MSRGDEDTVFVGRARELATLEQALERVQSGQPQAVLVMGETGVGKTRLVAEFARRSGVRMLMGRCLKFGRGAVPYLPLIEILRTYAREAPAGQLAAVLGPARAELSVMLPELAGARTVSAGPAGRLVALATRGEGANLERARLFERLLGVAERLGRAEPTLIVIEDAHWLDDSTRDMLVFLLHSVRTSKLILVITCRSDELPVGHPFLAITAELARAGVLHRLELGRLSRSEVGEQIAALASAELTPQLADQIAERSDGNPLFVEELVKTVASVTRTADSRARTAVSAALRDIMLGRMYELSEASRALVAFAATVGQRIDRPLLAASGLTGDGLLKALREATREQILVPVGSGIEDTYEFRHPMLQEVIYDALLPIERVRGHGAIARALSEQYVNAPDTSALLAHHWYAAREFGRALPAAVEAGHSAYLAYAFAEARRHFERALEFWSLVPFADDRVGIDRLALLEYATECAARLGDYGRGLELGRQVLAEVDADANPARAAAAHSRLRWLLWESGDHETAMVDAQEAVRLAPADPPSALRANALGHMAGLLLFSGDLERALELALESLAVAQTAGAQAEEALAVGIVGLCKVRLGEVEEGLSSVRRARDVAQNLDHPTGIALAYSQLAAVLDGLGRAEEALAVANDGVAAARRLGLERTFGILLRGTAVHALYELGRWREAGELMGRSGGEGALLPDLWLSLSEALLACGQGRWSVAEQVLRRLRPLAGQPAWREHEDGALLLEALLRLGRAEPAEVRPLVDRAAELAAEGSLDSPSALLLVLGVRAEAELAERARAVRDDASVALAQRRTAPLLRLLRRRADLPSLAQPLGAAQLAEAEAEATRVRGQSRASAWASAAETWARAGRPARVAWCRLHQAEAIVRAGGSREPATVALLQAHRIAMTLGAGPLVDEIEQLARRARLPLAASIATSVPAGLLPPAQAGLELTDREREVLALVAEGRTNREIGELLFISPKTASVHVSHILAKLGVDRRVEAAGLAHRLGLVRPAGH